MRIIKEPTNKYKYALDCQFNYEILNFCRALKGRVGISKFGYEFSRWRFNDLSIAYVIRSRFPQTEMDASTGEDLAHYALEQQSLTLQAEKAEKLKTTLESNLNIKGLKGEPRPYQKVAVEFFVNNNGRAILADTMGLGKTLSALSYAVHEKKTKVLVVCPASVKYPWYNEVKKWTKLKPCLIDGSTIVGADLFNEHNVFIINYDILKRFHRELIALNWQLAIFDEFHYIKNPAAQRTKYARLIASKVPSVLLLSGTPLLSRPVELFTGLQIMDPYTWNNFRSFTIRYCNGHEGYFGWDARGATNIEELKLKIGRYFLRRTKDEVLKELPPKQFIDIPVTLDKETEEKYRQAEASFQKYLKEVKKKNDVEIRRSLQAIKLTKLQELRQLASSGKIEGAKEVIQNIIDGDEKVVVFSAYNEPLKILKEHFGDQAVILMGDTNMDERPKIIDQFQKDPKIKIFLGGIKSAGVGITLTAAANVLFIDYSWVPADHAQAQDRIHRISQTANHVSVYQIIALNTIDEYMQQLLKKKQAIFDLLIDGRTAEKNDITGDLIKMIENKPLC